jgi:hypothetical protein
MGREKPVFIEHSDNPFRVVGILAPSGTMVDRAVPVNLEGMDAIHAEFDGEVHSHDPPGALFHTGKSKAEAELKAEGVDIDGLLARRAEITEERSRRACAVNTDLDGVEVRMPGFPLPLEYTGKKVSPSHRAVSADEGGKYAGDGFQLRIEGEQTRLGETNSKLLNCRNDRRRVVWERAKLEEADFRAVVPCIKGHGKK